MDEETVKQNVILFLGVVIVLLVGLTLVETFTGVIEDVRQQNVLNVNIIKNIKVGNNLENKTLTDLVRDSS